MALSKTSNILREISLTGVVQGVGFRPFVYNLAERFSLHGWVLNNSGGVQIQVEGPPQAVEAFIAALPVEAPPLARIESIEIQGAEPHGYDRFEIRHSQRQEGRYQLISPDTATCPDCLSELLDPADRRYRYPFTNCTNCGPRFTIITDIPYDRPNTTMRVFGMCADCQREYDDPRDRRFHAQPNACPVCGPRLDLIPGPDLSAGNVNHGTTPTDVIAQSAGLLREGAILAIKGLGGFHLACDATDAGAVQRLRERKRRPHKPFAVMIATLNEAREHCRVSADEEKLLTSPQCPIVLLPWKHSSTVAPEVAPHYRYLGVMLPYTPLHHVLLRDAGRPLVMTSGNLTEEPIAAGNDEALRRLAHLADAFVLHNRGIHARYDDSVWFVSRIPYTDSRREGREGEAGISAPGTLVLQPVRRARGYAPYPVKLPYRAQQTLACGAEVKNTFCLARDEYAFVSQHIGDMGNLETLEQYERTIELYKDLFRVEPRVVAYDLHPDYMATKYAVDQLETLHLEPVAVQHHHAHLASCLADNGWDLADGPVIGVSLDGTGYGQDSHIWGGEWLVGDYEGYRRAGQLEYLPLPGGDIATRNPWRIAFSYLHTLLSDVPWFVVPRSVEEAEVELLRHQIDRRLNSPLTSSMGRLFDAVAALLGVRTQTTYEAQAAIELEMTANAQVGERGERANKGNARAAVDEAYPFRVDSPDGSYVVRLAELLGALVQDLQNGRPVAEISWHFHRTIARMTADVCERIAADTGLRTVALSGGCFQNRLLLSMAVPDLRAAGFQVLLHRQVPCNDGGLSLGQAAIAHFASQS